MQPVDDVLQFFSLVLEVDHVGLGEDRAPAGDVRGMLAREPQPNEILEDPVHLVLGNHFLPAVEGRGQALGLLIDERPRSGGTGAVRVEVLQLPPFGAVVDLEE